MKDPHDLNSYTKLDEPSDSPADAQNGLSPADGRAHSTEQKKPRRIKELSGAYYYAEADAQKLSTASFARTALTVICFLLHLTVQIMPTQAGADYVSKNIPSYGLLYVLLIIFGVGFTSIWLFIMNAKRYKFDKRIPVERAPKGGFKRRAYFGAELYLGINAAVLACQLSFVCIRYDGWGLVGLFITALAFAAALAARQITHLTLKNSSLVPAAPEQTDETQN